ncbi:MAG: hypothetical protein M1837_002015 [Sclerophora amabilis]|nr:MAG: hypothetical protein M1837_002015 [Sclerophora amabilis]
MRDKVLYLFGDTFCKDSGGEFVGLVNNTLAVVEDSKQPLISKYPDIAPDGKVEPFFPLGRNEGSLTPPSGQGEPGRTIFWSFGGIAEEYPDAPQGWCWYQKSECFPDQTCNNYLGTGVAEILWDNEKGKPDAVRVVDDMFEPGEPRFGTFATLSEGVFIYLWGHQGDSIVLGRVRSNLAYSKNAYQYWNGEQYVSNVRDAKPIMHQMQHGAFWRSKLFCPGQGRDYVFVGVNSFGDSKVLMATAAQIEGPWEMTELCMAQPINHPSSFLYCVFPHPWAFKEEDGELMVTWSEQCPGGVVAAKLKFEMGPTTRYMKYPTESLTTRNMDVIQKEIRLSEIARDSGTGIWSWRMASFFASGSTEIRALRSADPDFRAVYIISENDEQIRKASNMIDERLNRWVARHDGDDKMMEWLQGVEDAREEQTAALPSRLLSSLQLGEPENMRSHR